MSKTTNKNTCCWFYIEYCTRLIIFSWNNKKWRGKKNLITSYQDVPWLQQQRNGKSSKCKEMNKSSVFSYKSFVDNHIYLNKTGWGLLHFTTTKNAFRFLHSIEIKSNKQGFVSVMYLECLLMSVSCKPK